MPETGLDRLLPQPNTREILQREYDIPQNRIIEVSPGWTICNIGDEQSKTQATLGIHFGKNETGDPQLLIRRIRDFLSDKSFNAIRRRIIESANNRQDDDAPLETFEDIEEIAADRREMDLQIDGEADFKKALSIGMSIIASPYRAQLERVPDDQYIARVKIAR